jgi:nucleoside-diphosphate-sugar epimerase
MDMNVLITGGAGFIGSNLARCLVASGYGVRILDDLSTGYESNLEDLRDDVELRIGDVRDHDAAVTACRDVDAVFHLAALPSVARSVEDPLRSNSVNVDGTLSILVAARDAGVRRVVYASSSSVYGNTPTLPKREDMATTALSPYAASKLAGEAYCAAFANAYDLETVSLRFFNVFGPRQDPGSPYAAVIPVFVARMLAGEPPLVFGDGSQSRDFTFVASAVQACFLAATADSSVSGEAMNIAGGARITLLDLIHELNQILGTAFEPLFTGPRPGDVLHSLADISKAARLLGYQPHGDVRAGLRDTVAWYAAHPQAQLAGEPMTSPVGA